MSKGKKLQRHLNDSYLNQMNVLKVLCVEGVNPIQPRSLEITEIAERSGLGDEKETLRYLYILEGHKLVTPNPAGDFTSKVWRATEDGLRAFKSLERDATM